MKIQITPKKLVNNAIVMWFEETPEVEIKADPRHPNKSIANNSCEVIYAFNLLGFTEPKNLIKTMKNLYDALKENGELYIIETDFDYVNRAYLGGDLKISEFNTDFRRASYLNQHETVRLLKQIGAKEDDMRIWLDNFNFPKAHFEFVLSIKKKKG